MANDRKRTIGLVAVLVVVGALVAWDRGLLGSGGEASPGARQRYALVNAQLTMQQDLLDSEDALVQQREQARQDWDRLRDRLVLAPTAEVAPASLRERVNEELRRHGVNAVRVLSEEVRRSGDADGAPTSTRVIPIRIRISFDAPDSETLYRAIASLDGTDRLHARVAELTIRGGGVNTQVERVSATLTIDTAVILGEGG